MVESDYQDLLGTAALRVHDGRTNIRVISGGLEGVTSAIRNHTPVQYLDLRVEAGDRVSLPIPAEYNGFVHVLEGAAKFGADGVRGEAGQVLWLDFPAANAEGTSAFDVVAETPTRLLLVAGQPLRERVVAYGPFVMNTEEEIHQAYRDFHAGQFGGPTPASAPAAQRA
jgi:redox-sensitive bicupin YhaK (pirin superfamily)